MNHLGTLTLKTDRLTLRPFSLEDAPAMYKNWANDPKVTRFLTWQPHESVEATRNLLAGWISQYGQPNTYNWCIVPEGTQEPVGNISVVRMMDDIESAEIGYCLGATYWNRGIMSEAFAAVIEFLFDRVGVNRICARHSVSNPASCKNAGFKKKACAVNPSEAATDSCTIWRYTPCCGKTLSATPTRARRFNPPLAM